jgi:predicted DNA-binding transcriptional regulator AlpA
MREPERPFLERRLLTAPQLAQPCALATQAIWTAIADGRLSSLKFGRRATRIEESELARFIDAARTAAAK